MARLSAAQPARRTALLAAALLALAPAAWLGCAGRSVVTPVVEDSELRVFLRHREAGGEIVDRGYDHPTVISAERLAHILALVDVTTEDDDVEERRYAVASDLLGPVSDALFQALREAGPGQEVVVMAIDRKRRLGIFTRKHLTTFVAFVQGTELVLDFARVDWEIPKRREDRLPEPELGEREMDFRVAPARAMRRLGPQTLAVDWRDDVFREPVAVRREEGEVRRREVLMETPRPPGQAREPQPLPSDLSPEALRALAELEELRRDGRITEAEYQLRRQAILEGGSD